MGSVRSGVYSRRAAAWDQNGSSAAETCCCLGYLSGCLCSGLLGTYHLWVGMQSLLLGFR
jgi:hypothetical protein